METRHGRAQFCWSIFLLNSKKLLSLPSPSQSSATSHSSSPAFTYHRNACYHPPSLGVAPGTPCILKPAWSDWSFVCVFLHWFYWVVEALEKQRIGLVAGGHHGVRHLPALDMYPSTSINPLQLTELIVLSCLNYLYCQGSLGSLLTHTISGSRLSCS